MCVSYFCYALASSHDPAAQKADLISFYKNQTCSVPVHTHLIDTAINEALFRQKKLYFNIPLLKRIPVNAPHTYAQDYKTVHKPCIRENEKKKNTHDSYLPYLARRKKKTCERSVTKVAIIRVEKIKCGNKPECTCCNIVISIPHECFPFLI